MIRKVDWVVVTDRWTDAQTDRWTLLVVKSLLRLKRDWQIKAPQKLLS